MKCKDCFHYDVCLGIYYTYRYNLLDEDTYSCNKYVDAETTITIPTISEKDSKKIREMASNGYAFVHADFLQNLVNESAELAKIKLKLARMQELNRLADDETENF